MVGICAASKSTFTTRLTSGVLKSMPLSEPGESVGRGIGVNAGGPGKFSLAPCTRLTPMTPTPGWGHRQEPQCSSLCSWRLREWGYRRFHLGGYSHCH
eukprot:1751785-Amphidinium_carterae.1